MRLPSELGYACAASTATSLLKTTPRQNSFFSLQLRCSPLNQPDNQHNDGNDQQDMNKASSHMTDKSK